MTFDAGLGLIKMPALRLFCPVVLAAERSEPAFAGASALIMRQRMIIVAALSGAAAAGSGAGPLPGFDDVMQ